MAIRALTCFVLVGILFTTNSRPLLAESKDAWLRQDSLGAPPAFEAGDREFFGARDSGHRYPGRQVGYDDPGPTFSTRSDAVPMDQPPATDAKLDSAPTGDILPSVDDAVKAEAEKPKEEKKDPKWYDKLRLRGYVQFRYNQLGATNPDLRSAQGDRSIGEDNGFFIRRARLVISGDVHERVSIYIQPDFASAVATDQQNFAQLRDAYADIFLDDAKEHRFRVGQSKVPYGFENLQSSQNRLALDRNDALNSGVLNERDIGVMYYWAPDFIRDRFKALVDDGLKGSGDYGVLGLGIYNGQTANRSERNDDRHFVARLSYPFEFANGQIFEPGISGYTGIYTIDRDAFVGGGNDFRDERMALSFTLYPQPWGLQGEYTWGVGPQLNDALNFVDEQDLSGGYIQLFYKWDTACHGTVIPFTRFQHYDGGRKHERNSPHNVVDEAEIGVEWAPINALELTAMYTITDRPTSTFPYPQESGRLLRLQLQWNY